MKPPSASEPLLVGVMAPVAPPWLPRCPPPPPERRRRFTGAARGADMRMIGAADRSRITVTPDDLVLVFRFAMQPSRLQVGPWGRTEKCHGRTNKCRTPCTERPASCDQDVDRRPEIRLTYLLTRSPLNS